MYLTKVSDRIPVVEILEPCLKSWLLFLLSKMEALERIARRATLLNPQALIAKTFEDRGIQLKAVELNQDQLYFQGIDNRGRSLGKYSIQTQRKKAIQGRPTDHVTLFDTGEFYDSMFVSIFNTGEFEIIADPIKGTVSLYKKYGGDITGLTEKSIVILIKDIIPLLRELYRKALTT